MPRRRGAAHLLAALVLVALPALGACAGGDDDVATPADAPTSETTRTDAGETTTSGGEPGGEAAGGSAGQPADESTSLVAQARGGTLGIWSTPDEADQPDRTLQAADEASGHIVLLVKQQLGPTWLEAYLPTAPAGGTGWIQRDDVTLSHHRFRIEVSRSAHTLTVYAGDVPALETPVAVGPDAPEPTEGLFIKELVEIQDPAGPYGRYSYGLPGSSGRAEDFAAGTGVVGIHGTDDESTLGQDVDRGSLAIGADDLDRLVTSIGLPLGTPVAVVP